MIIEHFLQGLQDTHLLPEGASTTTIHPPSSSPPSTKVELLYVEYNFVSRKKVKIICKKSSAYISLDLYLFFKTCELLAKLYSRNRDFSPAPVCVIDRLISRRNVRSKRILTVTVSCVTNFKFNRTERIETKELDTTEENPIRTVCMYLRFAQKQSYVIESFHET